MKPVQGQALALVIMGVAGAGKTTTAQNLSRELGWPYRDADEFHPPTNVAKMSRGEALTDEDRRPWLQAIASWMDEKLAAGQSCIVTCSALKRAYRDVLVGGRTGVRIIHLVGSRELIGGRMAARKDHFMPTSLLDSQFATLEQPADEEHVLNISVAQTPAAVVREIVARLGLEG